METLARSITAVARAEPGTVPALLAAGGPRAEEKFVEFFTAHIRNSHTRAA